MNDILRVKRIDEDVGEAWNENISMIISTDCEKTTNSLIDKYLLKDRSGNNIVTVNGDLTREFIQIEKLGTSGDIQPGVLLIENLGA